MGSYFHDWINYHGVAFSIVTRTGLHICGNFEGKKILVGGEMGRFVVKEVVILLLKVTKM